MRGAGLTSQLFSNSPNFPGLKKRDPGTRRGLLNLGMTGVLFDCRTF
jgi:hypothetical protein